MLYHVSVAEFYDSDGNNVGDLSGVEKRVEYFKYLGEYSVCWVSFPFFE